LSINSFIISSVYPNAGGATHGGKQLGFDEVLGSEAI
jgi:hypothetical protein